MKKTSNSIQSFVYESKQLSISDSRSNAVNKDGVLLEDVIKDLKKNPRSTADGKAAAAKAAIQGFSPYTIIANRHDEAKKAALAQVASEFKKNKKVENDKVTVSTNFMKKGVFVPPESGILEIGVHVYMPAKKGFFGRLLSGHMGNWFQDVGVAALQAYVKAFASNGFEKNVTKDTVFNAVGEGENAGKVSYFVCLAIPTPGK